MQDNTKYIEKLIINAINLHKKEIQIQSRLTILVVNNDRSSLELMKLLFSCFDCDLITALNGIIGLEMVNQNIQKL